MLKFGVAFEPLVQMDFTQMTVSCISSNNITYSFHVHASYCCICLCLIVGTVLLDRSSSGDRSRVPVRGAVFCTLFYQASKPPCSFRYNPSLAPAPCYCIRTTKIQLLFYVAVVEPIPLHDLSLPQYIVETH